MKIKCVSDYLFILLFIFACVCFRFFLQITYATFLLFNLLLVIFIIIVIIIIIMVTVAEVGFVTLTIWLEYYQNTASRVSGQRYGFVRALKFRLSDLLKPKTTTHQKNIFQNISEWLLM